MNQQALLQQVEGKPAPDSLLVIQAFVNTLDVEDGTDRLETLQSWRQWLQDSELIVPGARLGSDHLDEAREVREAVRALLAANSGGSSDRGESEQVAKLLGDGRVTLTGGDSGALGLDLAPARDPRHFIAQLRGIVYEAQLKGSWPRLKLCENAECSWAFYDSSRNRSGSWCRMGECGNRLKNRAYRARQRSRRGGGSSGG
jgi:predicted RNA-binding Zn ribbon-like protein